MDIKIKLIIGIGIVLALIGVMAWVRRRKVELRYALPWMIVLVAIFFFNCFPKITSILAEWVGISYPVNMLFFLGFCFFLYIIFGLTGKVSRLSNKVKILTQELALLQKEEQEDGEE